MTRRRSSLAVSCGSVAVTAAALLESGGPMWLAALAGIALLGVWGCLR
jgi:hypothetical protein